MKKRLAIIGVGILSDGVSNQGIPAFINALKELSKLYNITVYSFIPVDKSQAPRGIRVRCIRSKRIPQKIQFLLLGFAFFKDHLLHRYNVIHAQSPFPAGTLASNLSHLFKIPWVLSFHAGEAAYMPEVPFGDLLNPVLARANKSVTAKANAIMAMSASQARTITANSNVQHDIQIIPRGIVVPPFSAKELTSPIQLLHISNYHPIKDQVTLLKVVAEISKSTLCHLTIAGANYNNEFKALIKEVGLEKSVTLLGSIPHDKIRLLFDNAHILLHTSRFEGLPMVALEAMAHGVVVCGTHVGIMADLSETCCVTVPVGNFTMLAQRVIDFSNDKKSYELIRKRAHQWVSEHDMSWYIRALDDCYTRVCAE